MPLRIDEVTSNVQVTGENKTISENEILRIVNIVLERIREKQEHQNRIWEESKIRKQVSDIEPY